MTDTRKALQEAKEHIAALEATIVSERKRYESLVAAAEKERDAAIRERDDARQLANKYYWDEYEKLIENCDDLQSERDEARRLARRFYQKANELTTMVLRLGANPKLAENQIYHSDGQYLYYEDGSIAARIG